MRILKKILLGLAALLILLAIIGLFLPDKVHIERSTVIAAPPAAVFSVVNNMTRFNEWSPWFERDPGMKQTYSGPDMGVGAKLSWHSDNPEVGSGSQEIIESEPNSRVRNQLDFGPQGKAIAQFQIEPVSGGAESRVTWGFDTQFGFDILGRYFGLLMDKMVGPDFDKGLAKLKAVVENEAASPTARVDIGETDVSAQPILAVEGTAAQNPDAIAAALAAAYARIEEFMKAQGLTPAGAPLAINRFYDESGWGFTAALPYGGSAEAQARARTAAAKGPIKVMETYAGRAIKGVHTGTYAALPDTYRQMEDYLANKGLESNGPSWELYVSNPMTTPSGELRTEVFMPVKPAKR